MAGNYDDGREVTYEIVEEIGILSSQSTGWTKELNVVSWNGGQAKYDIREWSPHHDRMSRGMTFNEQEMRMILDLMKRRIRYVPRGVVAAQGSRLPAGSALASDDGYDADDVTGAERVVREDYDAGAGSASVPDPADDAAWSASA